MTARIDILDHPERLRGPFWASVVMHTGMIGAFIGGVLFGALQGGYALGSTGFWGSVLVAFLGACVLLVLVRFMGVGRRT